MKYLPLLLIFCLIACGAESTDADLNATSKTEVISEDSGPMAPNPLESINDNMAVPAHWQVSLDDPSKALNVHAEGDSTSGIYFVNMKPGWHIRTGPAAIFSHPSLSGSGSFKAETAIHLFDPGQRKESFGLFFGAQNLDTDQISYDYFLIRQGGEFLIKRRSGEETTTIVPWTPHEAIMSFTDKSVASELNTLSVEVGQDSVFFSVNEVRVAGLASGELETEGLVGLRVNHALDLHISDISVN